MHSDSLHVVMQRHRGRLVSAHEQDEFPGVKIKKRVPDAKSSAVYGSRTHDFCLSILTRVASIWEGSVLNH